MDDVLVKFNDVTELFNEYKFYGHTAKRGDNRKIEYTFISISWPKALYKVTTIIVNDSRIVIGITLNNDELDGWDELVSSLKNINKIYPKLKKI